MKNSIMQLGIIILGTILSLGYSDMNAQTISYENQIEIILDDDINVTLFKDLNNNNYYYLPPPQSLRLSTKDVEGEDTPEFLFLKYTTNENTEQGGIQGGLLHFLLEWGLTSQQLSQLDEKLKERTNNWSHVKGPIDLEATAENSFQIVSAVLTDDEFATNFSTSGKAPPMAGGKAAVATKLTKEGAQILAATFDEANSITDVSLALNYSYTTIVKAAKGKLTYNWESLEEKSDAMVHEYLRKELDGDQSFQRAMNVYEDLKKEMGSQNCGMSSSMQNLLLAGGAADAVIGNTGGSRSSGGTYEYFVGEETMRKIYEFMEEQEVIKLEWEETLADDRLEVIRTAFFQYFLNAFADQEFPDYLQLPKDENGPKVENPIKNHAEGMYTFKSCTELESRKSKYKELRLENIKLPVKKSFQMVTNLASTYKQVEDNPNCVASVILDEPFFQHRDINFILDLESHAMFDSEVNYVNIEVKKTRSEGNDFRQSITIDPQTFQDRGATHSVTYARGEDTNSDTYKYKVQWSLKGGQLYPENPQFVKGDWSGVTLTPPIQPRLIEFEADLGELSSMGIVRATLELRYYKYGKEILTNIPMRVSKGQPLVEKMIFTDRDATAYAYRLILTHREKGKMALEWETSINDDYIYATIPEELREEDPTFIEKVIEVGKETIRSGSNGTVSEEDAILDKFKDIFNN